MALDVECVGVPVVSFLAYVLVPAGPRDRGRRWWLLIGALAALVVVFLRRGLPESPRWLAKHGHLAEADCVLKGARSQRAAIFGRGDDDPFRSNRSPRKKPISGPTGAASATTVV